MMYGAWTMARANLCVIDLDGVQPAWDLHEGRVQEIALELLRLQGITHDHQLQVGALLQHLQGTGFRDT